MIGLKYDQLIRYVVFNSFCPDRLELPEECINRNVRLVYICYIMCKYMYNI